MLKTEVKKFASYKNWQYLSITLSDLIEPFRKREIPGFLVTEEVKKNQLTGIAHFKVGNFPGMFFLGPSNAFKYVG